MKESEIRAMIDEEADSFRYPPETFSAWLIDLKQNPFARDLFYDDCSAVDKTKFELIDGLRRGTVGLE